MKDTPQAITEKELPPLSATTLQDHINKKAHERAVLDWVQFETLLSEWMAERPPGYLGNITRKPTNYWSPGSAPLVRLVADGKSANALVTALEAFAVDYVLFRREKIAKDMAEELIAKASILP